jgi:hypothetical protein
MTGEKVNFDKAKAETAGASGPASSTISFPNVDLDAAIAIARYTYSRAGLSKCRLDELAAEAGVTVSGSFRVRIAAAKTFGFVEKDGQSALKLTDLGARVVSEDGETNARADAFMNVPLFSQIYEKYRGKLLPPTKALEREMVTLGVIPTMSTQARQIMQRSARQAGYFGSGEDRLVRPRATGAGAETLDQAVADAPPSPHEEEAPRRSGGGGAGGGQHNGGQYHPFIQGLLQTLPEPGTLWTVEGRAAWLQAAAQNFTLIYQGEGKIDVQISLPPKADKAA